MAKFLQIATSRDVVAAVAENAFTGRLLSVAHALDAVVEATGNRMAARQLKSLAWELCQRSGGKVCTASVDCQGSCTLLATEK